MPLSFVLESPVGSVPLLCYGFGGGGGGMASEHKASSAVTLTLYYSLGPLSSLCVKGP